MKIFKVNTKVALMDGSMHAGELVKVGGVDVTIKSLPGEENFSRKGVLKIDYLP